MKPYLFALVAGLCGVVSIVNCSDDDPVITKGSDSAGAGGEAGAPGGAGGGAGAGGAAGQGGGGGGGGEEGKGATLASACRESCAGRTLGGCPDDSLEDCEAACDDWASGDEGPEQIIEACYEELLNFFQCAKDLEADDVECSDATGKTAIKDDVDCAETAIDFVTCESNIPDN